MLGRGQGGSVLGCCWDADERAKALPACDERIHIDWHGVYYTHMSKSTQAHYTFSNVMFCNTGTVYMVHLRIIMYEVLAGVGSSSQHRQQHESQQQHPPRECTTGCILLLDSIGAVICSAQYKTHDNSSAITCWEEAPAAVDEVEHGGSLGLQDEGTCKGIEPVRHIQAYAHSHCSLWRQALAPSFTRFKSKVHSSLRQCIDHQQRQPKPHVPIYAQLKMLPVERLGKANLRVNLHV